MADQPPLWHDSPEEALDTTVKAAGGYKRVAERLWPADKPETAYNKLKHILDPTRSEKFSLGELLLVVELGRDSGDHSFAQYFGHRCKYKVEPIADEENKKRVRDAKIQFHLSEAARLVKEQR